MPSLICHVQPFQLEDVNRDGLVDIVRDKFFTSPNGALAVTEDTLLNQGPDPAQPGSFRFSPEAIVRFAPAGSTPTDVTLAQVADCRHRR